MGRQIIRQPDGKYALWSSGHDHFCMADVTLDEIIEWESQQAADQARADWKGAAERAEKTGTSGQWVPFAMTWEKCIERIAEVHGAEEAERRQRLDFSDWQSTTPSTPPWHPLPLPEEEGLYIVRKSKSDRLPVLVRVERVAAPNALGYRWVATGSWPTRLSLPDGSAFEADWGYNTGPEIPIAEFVAGEWARVPA